MLLLSTDFPTLELLKFNGGGFVKEEETIQDDLGERINISMPHTAIDTLEMFMDPEETSSAHVMLFSVCSTEGNNTRYYHDATQDDPTLEITKAQFDQLQETVDEKDCIVISICCKSIRHISFWYWVSDDD